jgi:hypothetical protein
MALWLISFISSVHLPIRQVSTCRQLAAEYQPHGEVPNHTDSRRLAAPSTPPAVCHAPVGTVIGVCYTAMLNYVIACECLYWCLITRVLFQVRTYRTTHRPHSSVHLWPSRPISDKIARVLFTKIGTSDRCQQVLAYRGVVWLFNMLHFKMSCVYCC